MKVSNERIKPEAKVRKEETAKVSAAATPVHKEKVSQKIYVGPNLLGLTKYTVVESTKVAHVQTFVKDCPGIEKLFVPIEKMAETEARIGQKGTLENRHFNKVAEFKAGKGDK